MRRERSSWRRRPEPRVPAPSVDLKSACLRGLLLLGALLALASPAAAATPRILAIHFGSDLEVNPVTQGWVNHQLERAKDDGYSAAVILLDTPGGLSSSMRKIYQKELGSPIPVIVYVAPDGARAGSAGLWISEAADVLAMAPQTNIGASTPINAGGADLDKDLRKKVINDAVASVVALAKSHGRDTKFPARAVRQAASIDASSSPASRESATRSSIPASCYRARLASSPWSRRSSDSRSFPSAGPASSCFSPALPSSWSMSTSPVTEHSRLRAWPASRSAPSCSSRTRLRRTTRPSRSWSPSRSCSARSGRLPWARRGRCAARRSR